MGGWKIQYFNGDLIFLFNICITTILTLFWDVNILTVYNPSCICYTSFYTTPKQLEYFQKFSQIKNFFFYFRKNIDKLEYITNSKTCVDSQSFMRDDRLLMLMQNLSRRYRIIIKLQVVLLVIRWAKTVCNLEMNKNTFYYLFSAYTNK